MPNQPLPPMPESYFEEVKKLRALFSYTRSAQNVPTRGRFTDTFAQCLYWPHIYENYRFLSKLADIVLPLPQRQREAHQDRLRISSTNEHSPEYLTWLARRVRQLIEELLGPLLLPHGVAASDKLIDDYAFMHEDPETTPAEEAISVHPQSELREPHQYICWRKVNTQDGALLRTRVVPPLPTATAFFVDVPPPLVVLYHAWRTLVQRQELGFDSQEIGVEYVRSGHLLVNWRRFFQSRYWPREVRLQPDEVHDKLLKLPTYCSLRTGVIDIDLTTRRPIRGRGDVVDRELKSLSLYLELALGTEAITLSTTDAEPCTIIDPLRLLCKENVFNGLWHHDKLERVRQTARRFHQRQTSGEVVVSNAQVHTLRFCPGDYLKDLMDHDSWEPWFLLDQEETIYAIRHKGQLAFTNPPQLPAGPPSEHEVWRRALDSVKLVDRFRETPKGEALSSVEGVCRSRFFSEMRQEKLMEFAEGAVATALAANKLSRRKLIALKQEVARGFSQETGLPGQMWYHRGVIADAARQLSNPLTYRVVRNVAVPDDEAKGVHERHFFTVEGVDLFLRFAKASFNIMPPDTAGDRVQQSILSTNAGPAPYVLAWARFCVRAQELTLSRLVKREGGRRGWTPREDCILLTHYRRHPRMSPATRNELRKQLPGHDDTSWYHRMRLLKQHFDTGLRQRSRLRLLIGRRPLPPVEARRAVLMLNYILYCTRRGEQVKSVSPVFSHYLNMEERVLNATPLPASYSADSLQDVLSLEEHGISSASEA